MSAFLDKLTLGLSRKGCLAEDVTAFFCHHSKPKTTSHSAAVAVKASDLASHFGLDPVRAWQAGWLHDVSAVIPNAERVAYARALGLEVLPEELQLPMILHQKLSRILALEIFSIYDVEILNAVECHTTLKGNAQPLDKVLFVADKLAWDQDGIPPYANAMHLALDMSLDDGVCFFLSYLWRRRESLQVIHPWLIDAIADMCKVNTGVRDG